MDLNSISSGAVKYVPVVLGLVKEAVEIVESPGNGAAKAAGALALVQVSIEKLLPGNAKAEDASRLIEYARTMIPLVVSIFNTIGKFITSSPAPAPAPVVALPAPLPDPIAVLKAKIAELKAEITEATVGTKKNREKRLTNLNNQLTAAEKELATLTSL